MNSIDYHDKLLDIKKLYQDMVYFTWSLQYLDKKHRFSHYDNMFKF